MAILLVSHDLGVISETCDEIIVMYAGRTLEAGYGTDVMRKPRHPYTRGLIKAMPSLEVTDEVPAAQTSDGNLAFSVDNTRVVGIKGGAHDLTRTAPYGAPSTILHPCERAGTDWTRALPRPPEPWNG